MPSLIKAIALKNFKGFSDEVRIELRPVTLLFGGNSVGKSSIFQALQYVREILERYNANADRTLQGGEAVDLGGFLNLVHGRDPHRKIEVEVVMKLGAESIPELVPDSFEDWSTNDRTVWSLYEKLQSVRAKVDTVGIRLIVGWNQHREQPVVEGYRINTNGEWCIEIEASGDGRDVHMKINRENPIFMEETSDVGLSLSDLDDFVSPSDLGDTVSLDSATDSISEKLQPSRTRPLSVLPSILGMVKEAGMERPGDGLRAWLTGFRGALPRLDQMLDIPTTGAKGAQHIYIAREFTAFLSWLTIGPALLLRDQLRQMRYIGPLRRIPPRSFDVALTKSEAAWSDGMAAWETLQTGSADLVARVSDWMQSPRRLGTSYGVSRTSVQEFDLGTPIPQPTGRIRKRVSLVDSNGMMHQPLDVGVGIAQVLPVVVAAQDGSASVVCIEQPELHVHPAVQVGLGDLLIDGVRSNELSFLIETHSEHLILRLLRRVRESAEGSNTDATVDPSMIGVFYLSKEKDRITAIEIPINLDGEFDKPWPRGFFDERGAELF